MKLFWKYSMLVVYRGHANQRQWSRKQQRDISTAQKIIKKTIYEKTGFEI